MQAAPAALAHRHLHLPVELLLLGASLFWAVTVNGLFLRAALKGRDLADPTAWGLGAALFVALVALHFLLLAPLANRWTVKPLLIVLIVVTAFAAHFMQQFGVYLDPSMLRNVLKTDLHESRELISWSMLPHLALNAGLPLLLLSRVRLRQRRWPQALLLRAGSMLLALLLLVGAAMAVFQPLSSLMRSQKELRYLITPANYLWSLGSVAATEARGAAVPRRAIGLDARPGPRWAARTKPLLLVMVVGETARAANWGLNGYARQTTPELAALPVINFPQVGSCGTNTETSLPCMFAPVGRRDYDEASIRSSESLLHVLARAGVAVNWRDNQSGCKGACDGLPNESVLALNPPGLCAEGRCLDEGLLLGLDKAALKPGSANFLVLHMMGNHGPSYFRRYPPEFERFTPACRNDDLRTCSQQEIVNAYDNALLYTDHVLAKLITQLQARAAEVDSAVVYVSDHGESLGENNFFLHGLPYAIAPDVQKRVPMVMWLSDGMAASSGVSSACLRARAALPVTHDHLFHTVLGLLDVRTALHEVAWDLGSGCQPVATATARALP